MYDWSVQAPSSEKITGRGVRKSHTKLRIPKVWSVKNVENFWHVSFKKIAITHGPNDSSNMCYVAYTRSIEYRVGISIASCNLSDVSGDVADALGGAANALWSAADSMNGQSMRSKSLMMYLWKNVVNSGNNYLSESFVSPGDVFYVPLHRSY